MGEKSSRETQEIQICHLQTDEAKREEPRPAVEFEGYSLELLAVLEG